jgi:hypothetical protein
MHHGQASMIHDADQALNSVKIPNLFDFRGTVVEMIPLILPPGGRVAEELAWPPSPCRFFNI